MELQLHTVSKYEEFVFANKAAEWFTMKGIFDVHSAVDSRQQAFWQDIQVFRIFKNVAEMVNTQCDCFVMRHYCKEL